MQLQEALQAFLRQLSADGRSPHTIGQYRRHVTSLIDWVTDNDGGASVADLAPELLARFFSDDAAKKSCRGGPKKAVSLNAMRTSIRCFSAPGSGSARRCNSTSATSTSTTASWR